MFSFFYTAEIEPSVRFDKLKLQTILIKFFPGINSILTKSETCIQLSTSYNLRMNQRTSVSPGEAKEMDRCESPLSDTTVNDAEMISEGWLYKVGKWNSRDWKQRYFILDKVKRQLVYYGQKPNVKDLSENGKHVKPKGHIDLLSVKFISLIYINHARALQYLI